jgi:hypothetical protein
MCTLSSSFSGGISEASVALSEKTAIRKRQVIFQFPTDQGDPPLPDEEYQFFVAQSIAAVVGIEVVEQSGINERRRAMLV